MADMKNDPYEIVDAPAETAIFQENYEEKFDGFIRVGPKGYLLPKEFRNYAGTIYNTQTGPDQVFIGGFPRSGTTWTQQMVWLIVNDLDYKRSEETHVSNKCPCLERHTMVLTKSVKNNLRVIRSQDENIEEQSSYITHPVEGLLKSRFWKTHLPLSILHPTLLESSKMVYVARDPRDVIVSNYYFMSGPSGLYGFKRDVKSMWNFFMKGSLYFCPYFEHVKEFWEKRNHPNLLFLFYEDIRNDRLVTLRRVANFFNKSYTDEQLLELGKYIDFNNLKDHKAFNCTMLKDFGILKPDAVPFVRKGIVGDWRDHFDEEMTREAEQWIAENLRGTDLRFPTIPN